MLRGRLTETEIVQGASMLEIGASQCEITTTLNVSQRMISGGGIHIPFQQQNKFLALQALCHSQNNDT